jgi:hypothetical protein
VFGLAPSNLSLGFAPLVGFCCCVDNIKILGVLVGFASFYSSFLQKALGKDVHHVDVRDAFEFIVKNGGFHVLCEQTDVLSPLAL